MLDEKSLARVGASVRLENLEREVKELRKFLGMVAPRATANDTPTRKRKGMSATARKAVSRRMKQYWASRKAKGK